MSLLIAAVKAWSASFLPAGITVEEAVKRVEEEGLRVFYSTDLVKPWMRIQIEPAADDPAAALEEVLAPFGLAVTPGPGDSLLIVRRSEDPAADGATRLETATDSGAPFSPEPQMRALEEVIVATSQYELKRSPGASLTLFAQTDLEHLPDMGDDVIRAVSRLPGTASNGVGSLANVRGGEISETLIRLDGLRLYDPFHLSDFHGIFSSLDPRVIDSMDVFTGGFPASFGGRMSGVIDIHSMTPPADLYHEIGVSFFNSSMLSAGRFGDGRGEWLASARRSNLDVLYRTFSTQPDRPWYSDSFVKLAYQVAEPLTVTAHSFDSRDHITVSDDADREETARADHRDVHRWLRFDHTLTNGLTGTTILAHTRLDRKRAGTTAKEGISQGSLVDVRSFAIDSAQSEWTMRAGDRLFLGFGAEAATLRGIYDYQDEVDFDLLFDADGAPSAPHRSRSVAARPAGDQYALFASARYSPTPRLTTELGVRRDEQTIDAMHTSTFSPRIGIQYALTSATSLRANWGRFFQAQGINELEVSDGVRDFSKPQRSDHLIVGIEHVLARGLALRIEAYEKTMTSLKARYENMLNTLVLLPELKPDRIRIAPESARARGLELLMDGETGESLRWWFGYSWSRVTDRIEGNDVPRSWDQTHALTAGLAWDTPAWNVGVGLSHRSGWPMTQVAAQNDEADFPRVTLVRRNGERMDYFRVVDVRFTRKIELKDSSLWVSLELANLFDRANACCTEYEIGDGDDEGRFVIERLDYLPRIPSVGFIWKF